LDMLLWASNFSCSSRLSNIDNLLGVSFCESGAYRAGIYKSGL
jgi:hypothetical protein